MKNLISAYPVVSFCIFNILLALLLGFTFSFDYVPCQFFPGMLAIMLCFYSGGIRKVISLLRKLSLKRQYGKWYLLSLLYPLVISILAFIIFSYTENHSVSYPHLLHSTTEYLLFIPLIFWGSVGEELGWRGFMLPLLNKKFSLIKSALIIGLFWGLWHMYFFSGVYTFLIYLLLTMELSIVISWIQRKTNGNIVAAVISHSSFNISAMLFFEDFFKDENASIFFMIYTVIVGVSAIPVALIIRKIRIEDGANNISQKI